jgi:hypothetical protein
VGDGCCVAVASGEGEGVGVEVAASGCMVGAGSGAGGVPEHAASAQSVSSASKGETKLSKRAVTRFVDGVNFSLSCL